MYDCVTGGLPLVSGSDLCQSDLKITCANLSFDKNLISLGNECLRLLKAVQDY